MQVKLLCKQGRVCVKVEGVRTNVRACKPAHSAIIVILRLFCCAAVQLKKVLKADASATIVKSDIAGTIINVPCQLSCDAEVASKRTHFLE
jgi:hypothetical protein